MKKQKSKPGEKKVIPKPKPSLKWQTGKYERHAEYRFCLPYQFLLICKLLDITPRMVLVNFMDTIDCGSWKREGREKQRELLINYFIECGYGKEFYNEEERRKMFTELNAIGMLWPENAKEKLENLHVKWRGKYQTYWFKKWFGKLRRNQKKPYIIPI